MRYYQTLTLNNSTGNVANLSITIPNVDGAEMVELIMVTPAMAGATPILDVLLFVGFTISGTVYYFQQGLIWTFASVSQGYAYYKGAAQSLQVQTGMGSGLTSYSFQLAARIYGG